MKRLPKWTWCGVAEGLVMGVVAAIGCEVAVLSGSAIARATVTDPTLYLYTADAPSVASMALAVVPVLLLVTVVRLQLGRGHDLLSGTVTGLVVALVVLPPMIVFPRLPAYIGIISQAPPLFKGPPPPGIDVARRIPVGPQWLLPAAYLSVFIAAGMITAMASPKIESRVMDASREGRAIVVRSLLSATGLVGIVAFFYVALLPFVLANG